MWATGQKTIDERISQGPSSATSVPGTNLKTVLELAQAAGKKVGNVSTAEITDATPAVLASHISLRGCQGPANMGHCALETKAAGGLGSIAEQEVDHKMNVMLGGGRDRFTQTISGGPDAGKTVVQSAQGKGITYVTDAAGLSSIPNGSKPVMGLFSGANMSLEWTGPAAARGKGNTPVACTTGQRPANEPSLPAMTRKASSLLENGRGFFLQLEGASIDKQDHATNACGQLGETVAFDDAIGVALDYQRLHPDTLVVVTADHGHTSEIVSEDASGSGLPTGYSTNLTTADNQTLSTDLFDTLTRGSGRLEARSRLGRAAVISCRLRAMTLPDARPRGFDAPSRVIRNARVWFRDTSRATVRAWLAVARNVPAPRPARRPDSCATSAVRRPSSSSRCCRSWPRWRRCCGRPSSLARPCGSPARRHAPRRVRPRSAQTLAPPPGARCPTGSSAD